jgi:Cu/Ag efflux pump CusA
LFGPIFQGLAVSLMAGSLVSMIIAPVAVPLLYFVAYERKKTIESLNQKNGFNIGLTPFSGQVIRRDLPLFV